MVSDLPATQLVQTPSRPGLGFNLGHLKHSELFFFPFLEYIVIQGHTCVHCGAASILISSMSGWDLSTKPNSHSTIYIFTNLTNTADRELHLILQTLSMLGTRNGDCRFGPPVFILEGSKDAFVNGHFNHSVITLAG